MSGTVKLPHKCPNPDCKTVAKTHQEVEKYFGFRNHNGGTTNQSRCKRCR